MTKLDALLTERESIEAQKSTATLSTVYQGIIAKFLNNAATQAEFEKDVLQGLSTR